jgi:osmotically-inducible protein OsmY
MNGQDDGSGGASLGRVRPDALGPGADEGRRFFEKRMTTGDESQWTRWHEEGRWRDDARNVGRTWEAREPGQQGTRAGPYSGRGPRGWSRAPERLRDEVCESLAMDGGVDATDIEVSIDGHEVTLTGTVADRAQKRRAEEVVDGIDGVRDVHNRLRLAVRGTAL